MTRPPATRSSTWKPRRADGLRALYRCGLSIGAITRLLNEQRYPDAQANLALGALDGLGDAAQPGL